MKYLKMFNESQENDKIEEIKQFCEEALIDLLDSGYSVDVTYLEEASGEFHNHSLKNAIKVVISKKIGRISRNFIWDDVKDKMIPFLDILEDNYELMKPYINDDDNQFNKKKSNIILIDFSYRYILFTVKQLIEGKESIKDNLKKIQFYIKR